jgi:hypothetical protein
MREEVLVAQIGAVMQQGLPAILTLLVLLARVVSVSYALQLRLIDSNHPSELVINVVLVADCLLHHSLTHHSSTTRQKRQKN